MSFLTKLFKLISVFILSLILIIVGTLTWAFYNPADAFKVVEKYFLPKDLKITWESMDFQSHTGRKWDFFIDWEIKNLLITKQTPHLVAPIDLIHIKGVFEPFARKAFIENLQIDTLKTIEFKPVSNKDSEPEKNFFQSLQSVIQVLESIHHRVPYQNIQAHVQDFLILSDGSDPLHTSLNISTAEVDKNISFQFNLKREGVSAFSLSTDGSLNINRMNKDEDFLLGNVTFKGFQVSTSQSIRSRYSSNKAIFSAEGSIQYQKEKIKINSQNQVSLTLTAKQADLSVKATAEGLPGIIPKIKNANLTLHTPLDKSVIWSEKASDFNLEIPIELGFIEKSLKGHLQKSCNCQVPLSLLSKASGKVWLAFLFSQNPEQKKVLESELSIESYKNKLFSVDLASTLKIEKSSGSWHFFPVLNCAVSVHDFQGTLPLLQAFNILIPAPLDVLNGQIDFFANGPVKQDDKGAHFPAQLKVNLTSSKQIVRLQSDAHLSLSRDFKNLHIQNKARIQDLQLELPPLNPIGGKPRITPDKRILQVPPEKLNNTSRFAVSFDIQIETLNPGAIRLLSEYFKPHFPVTLKLQMDPNGPSGFVQAEPFDIVYLRRKVHVEKMRLDLNRIEEDILPVDGRLKVQQTHYTIYIDVKGNAKKPNITMTSEPELPESDIISVLLYDRVGDDLASADAETSAGVQAAVADRAIGLFGLWAFASTPIRSFSYNPVTKVYTATISLGGDVTAGIGTTWESTAQLELRKRVSKQWMLTARWTAATPEEGQTTELVLQWEKRY